MDQVIRSSAYERVARIERACEQALVGGICGVLVVDYGTYVEASPHQYVPYGKIYWCDGEALTLGGHVWTPEEN